MFKPVKTTPAEERMLSTARVAFMVASPFYSHLYHSLGKEVITRDVRTLATDGKHILINPDYFGKLAVSEQVFVLAHEMSHLVCRHPQRFEGHRHAGAIQGKPVSQMFANVCMDYVINADLVETGIGTCNPDWLLHPGVGGSDLWEDVYAKLWKDPPPPPPGGNKPCKDGPSGPASGGMSGQSDPPGAGEPPPSDTPEGNGVVKPDHETMRARDDQQHKRFAKPDPQAEANDGAFDQILEPAKDPVTGDPDLPDEHEFREAVAQAFAVAKAMGSVPASVQRLVDEVLDPQVDWREHIRMLITGKVGARGEDWKRPNRRRLALSPIVILPSKRGFGAETVVVGVDTSGSIGQKELATFLAEVGGILNDVKPRRIVVIGCDARVSQVDEVTTLDEFQGLREKGIMGGGGTDFRPVFDHVAEHDLRPEALIYLTDLYGRFPAEAPGYPVVWAATTDQAVPFGEVVRIKA